MGGSVLSSYRKVIHNFKIKFTCKFHQWHFFFIAALFYIDMPLPFCFSCQITHLMFPTVAHSFILLYWSTHTLMLLHCYSFCLLLVCIMSRDTANISSSRISCQLIAVYFPPGTGSKHGLENCAPFYLETDRGPYSTLPTSVQERLSFFLQIFSDDISRNRMKLRHWKVAISVWQLGFLFVYMMKVHVYNCSLWF